MRPVLIVAVVVAGCLVVGALSPANSQPPERLPDLSAPMAAPASDPHAPYGVGKAPFTHRPATSCAAASCHGGGQVGKVGSEHSTWAPEAFPEGATDPHSKAYRVLFNPVSVEMAKKLGLGEAHTAAVCLKCHAVETGGDPATRDQVMAEGVGCSACHGPADKWISTHYLPEWKTLTNREKWDKYGFVPANNLVARTLNCAGCHVGDADHDLNHDLYAAGHPRVTFEAARMHYQPDYRKHWTEKTPQPDFEVRLWVVGQAATLRKAVELLHSRATRAATEDPKTPWPEFAGYSCYACHQSVPSTEVRGVAGAGKRRPGLPGWEVWSNTAVGVAAESCELAFPGLSSPGLSNVKLPKLDKLRETMGKSISPPPAIVRDEAAAALKELDAWLAAMQAAEDRVKQQPVARDAARKIANRLAANALSADGKLLADHDWDALATNYLGAAAMYHASGGSAGNSWGAELTDVGRLLAFPAALKDMRFDSPADRTRAKLNTIRDKFETLKSKTGTSEGK